MRSYRICALVASTIFVYSGQASATFHLMQVEQVIGGVNGDTTAQAIQLRMRAAGQNQVSQGRLVVRDATGANPVTIVNMATNVANSALGARVLIASTNFSNYTVPAAVPDFTMTNLIPSSYLTAGSLTFEADLGGTIYWRLSWGGASYTGSGAGDITNDSDGNFNPPFNAALPSGSLQALQFNGTANALSTNNAAQYVATAGPATFSRNAGTSYSVVECTFASQCNDGLFCNGAESCTTNACAPGTDPCPGFTCDEASNMCGSCLSDADLNAQLGAGPDEGALGSILIFPKVELRWDLSGNLLQDTFIRISNSQVSSVQVQMYFVNGDPPVAAAPPERAHPGWNWVDNIIILTPSEPAYWSANTGSPKGVTPFTTRDPGTPRGRPDPDGNPNVRVLRGYIYAWAVSSTSPYPEISFNALNGVATIINYQEGSTWEYGAVAFQAVNAPLGTEPDGVRGQLLLDGVEYDAPFDTLLMDFISTGSTAMSSPTRSVTTDGELSLLPVGADFRQDGNGPTTTKATFLTYNANEVQFSGTQLCMTSWNQRLMSAITAPNSLQRSVLGTDAGRARIEGVSDVACTSPTGGASQAVPLVGVHAHRSSFAAPNARTDRSGTALSGKGSQSASILFDIVGDPPDATGEPATVFVTPGNEDRSRFSRKGSLLIFPKVEVKWDSAGNLTQDTFIQLSNDDRCGPVRVRLVYIHGDPPLAIVPIPFERAHTGWNHIYDDLLLTANQPVYWAASTGAPISLAAFTTLDPGNPPGRPDPENASSRALRGYLLVWAVDDDLEEIRWNHLSGRATVVNYSTGSVWDYNPQIHRARSGTQGLATDGVPGQLLMNGTEYDLAYNRLEFEFLAPGTTAFSLGSVTVNVNTELAMMPLDILLPSTGTLPTRTHAKFTVYNQNEVRFMGTERCVTAWDQALISTYATPNQFLNANLQTAAGRAQLDGFQSVACNGSIDNAMAAVVATRLTFTGGPGGSTAAGVSIGGAGEQTAAILVNAQACSSQSICNDFDSCTCDFCVSSACQHTAVEFGDVNCSGGAATTLDDILCVLSGFTNFANCPNGDIAPTTGPFACQGNNAIDLDDILSVLGAFAGVDPCGCTG